MAWIEFKINIELKSGTHLHIQFGHNWISCFRKQAAEWTFYVRWLLMTCGFGALFGNQGAFLWGKPNSSASLKEGWATFIIPDGHTSLWSKPMLTNWDIYCSKSSHFQIGLCCLGTVHEQQDCCYINVHVHFRRVAADHIIILFL